VKPLFKAKPLFKVRGFGSLEWRGDCDKSIAVKALFEAKVEIRFL
jgi:hypothetical protein